MFLQRQIFTVISLWATCATDLVLIFGIKTKRTCQATDTVGGKVFTGVATRTGRATFVHCFDARQTSFLADVGVVRVFFTIVAIVDCICTCGIVVFARQTSNAFVWVTVCHRSSVFVVRAFGAIGARASTRFRGRIRTGGTIGARYFSGQWLICTGRANGARSQSFLVSVHASGTINAR